MGKGKKRQAAAQRRADPIAGLESITVQVGPYSTKRVVFLPTIPALMKEYDLSPVMVMALAQAQGHYPIADKRTFSALVARGLYEEPETGIYYITEMGEVICEAMFEVIEL